MGPDLHIHSTASDGALQPRVIVERAAAMGLSAVAITDHDSVDGIDAAMASAADLPLMLIPAVELSAGLDGRGMHVLGYFIDHADAVLAERLRSLRALRLERAQRMVEALRAGGYRIAVADVLLAADGGAVGRAHVAQTLVQSGHATSVADAFERLLGRGKPYYVPKPVAPPAEVIGWIHDTGGIAVLAHPGVSEVDDLIESLVEAGLDGIEVFHAEHDPAEREYFLGRARSLGLVPTGGSDFHRDDRRTAAIGSADVPEWVLGELVARRSAGADAR